jgi:(p)ppGpp synthase/HD superfamily hydrolase
MTLYGLVDAAQRYAAEAHAGQAREGSGLPYICHPARVVAILQDVGIDSEEILAAAWLHDVVEDTDRDITDIRDRFGVRVAELVALVTKTPGYTPLSYYGAIRRDADAMAVKTADRVDNLREVHLKGAGAASRYLLETDRWFSVLPVRGETGSALYRLLQAEQWRLAEWIDGTRVNS